MIYRVRKLLVWFGKLFPFVLCFVVCVSYIETLVSIGFDLYCSYGEYVVPYKPLSWFFGDILTYDWHTISVAIVLSIAFETCIWNKLSILYLCANLFEKQCFVDEMEWYTIVLICATNIAVSYYLIYKGIRALCMK